MVKNIFYFFIVEVKKFFYFILSNTNIFLSKKHNRNTSDSSILNDGIYKMLCAS